MEEIRDDAPEQQPATKRKMPLVPIIIIVAAVVVIGVAGMFMLRGGKAEKTVEGREDIGASVEGAAGVASRITPDPFYYFEDEFKVNTKDGYFVSARIVLKLEDYYIGSASPKDGGEGGGGGHGGGEAAAGAAGSVN
jgi:flagellar basal body-associated protein FliL